ncbi:MAG: hypothetical protein C5B50_19310 [Verrucomicrobia bacterium]|nr:MAG: hypothetical protein C5B50_19310 [Verrucomicrobiota bacterium]
MGGRISRHAGKMPALPGGSRGNGVRRSVCALMIAALFAFGCASPNVNPVSAARNRGYVDFYADPAGQLCWDVAKVDPARGHSHTLFSEVHPVEGRILRLAFAPGRYTFRVTFLNRAVIAPVLVEVNVQEGRVSPVEIELTGEGTTEVRTKQVTGGGTVYGRYGRTTKIRNAPTDRFRLTATAGEAQPYQPKEKMPYAAAPPETTDH